MKPSQASRRGRTQSWTGAALGVVLVATLGACESAQPSPSATTVTSASTTSAGPSLAPSPSFPHVGGTWTVGPPLPTPRGEVAAAVLDGRLFVAGGFGDPRGSHSQAFEAFDPATSSWKELAPLPEGRDHAALTALGGRLYLTGGNTEIFAARANLWIYDPKADRWSAGPLMPDRRSAHAAVAVDGRLYVVGGFIPSRTFQDPTWRYDPTTGTWDGGLAPPPTYREHLAAVTVDGRIIAIGGRSATDLGAVERYDPATDTWAALPPLPTPRGGLTASVLDGAIHVIGGESIDSPRVFAQHEVLDLASLRWAIGPPLSRGSPRARIGRHRRAPVCRGGRREPGPGDLGQARHLHALTDGSTTATPVQRQRRRWRCECPGLAAILRLRHSHGLPSGWRVFMPGIGGPQVGACTAGGRCAWSDSVPA